MAQAMGYEGIWPSGGKYAKNRYTKPQTNLRTIEHGCALEYVLGIVDYNHSKILMTKFNTSTSQRVK